MGNNEPLPPPPPPGQPPASPPPAAPPPAAPPPYNPPPAYPPTQPLPPTQAYPPVPQYPPTQQLPPTQAFPAGPPGGFPPQGYAPGMPPAEPPAKKTGLFIALGLLVVALVVAGILIFTGGDDDEATPPTVVVPTLPQITIPQVTIPDITIPDITLPDVTFVITLPTATEAPATTAPQETAAPTTGGTPPGDFVSVTDDLGVFSAMLPSEFEKDTAPITTQDDFTLPSVAGADDLDAYNNDDTTRGLTIIAVGPEIDSSVDDVLTFLEPDEGVCSDRELNVGYPTALGASTMVKLDGCGTDGTGSKVIMVISLEGNTIVGLYVQSTDTATALLPLAQQVFESITAL